MAPTEQNEVTLASQSPAEDLMTEQPKSELTVTEEENPYLSELQKLQAAILEHNAKMAEWTPPGFNRAVRKYRRTRNYVARASRRYNRLRAKGARV